MVHAGFSCTVDMDYSQIDSLYYVKTENVKTIKQYFLFWVIDDYM